MVDYSGTFDYSELQSNGLSANKKLPLTCPLHLQVLGMGQMVSTLLVLQTARMCGYISIPKFRMKTLMDIWPLPVFYVGKKLRTTPNLVPYLTK